MTRYLLATALVALVCSVGTADDKPAVAPTTAAPVMIASPGTPVVEYGQYPSTRRGLFGRVRGRNAVTYPTAPMSPVPIIPGGPGTSAPTFTTPMPALVTPQPMPMPIPGARTSGMVPPTPPDGIVLAGGTVPASDVVVTSEYLQPGMVVTSSGYLQPVTVVTTNTVPVRRGLFGRVRTR
jgi:hypothetical protein